MTDLTFKSGDPGTAPDKDGADGNQDADTTTTFSTGDPKNNDRVGGLTREEIEQLLKRDQNAQRFIDQLKSERKTDRERIQEMEQRLSESTQFDDVIERMHDTRTTDEKSTTSVDVDELVTATERRIMESLTSREREQKERENFNKAVEDLRSSYGESFGQRIEERATQLNLPIEEMDRLAKTSPEALVELVRGSQNKGPMPTHSTTKTNVASQQPQDSLSYFEKVRVENPKEFYSPEFQARYNQVILDKARKEGRIN